MRVAHDSRRCPEVWLFAFETTSLAAVHLARLGRRHLAAGAVSRYTFLSLRKPPLPLRLENIRGRGQAQPARTAHHSVFAHSILHHARNRVTDVTRRRNAVLCQLAADGPGRMAPPPFGDRIKINGAYRHSTPRAGRAGVVCIAEAARITRDRPARPLNAPSLLLFHRWRS